MIVTDKSHSITKACVIFKTGYFSQRRSRDRPYTHQLPIVLKPNLAIVNDRLLALAYNLCWVSRGDVPAWRRSMERLYIGH
ncbi:hypothetical protein [Dactylococcopsis salina]|uniref:hypothetical protein n=1 Tax=Dactylococcopsis salina TaxID=292566 RepID=UPI0012EAA957|nr:hypothetical protein [Dactylococcopsis salina]